MCHQPRLLGRTPPTGGLQVSTGSKPLENSLLQCQTRSRKKRDLGPCAGHWLSHRRIQKKSIRLTTQALPSAMSAVSPSLTDTAPHARGDVYGLQLQDHKAGEIQGRLGTKRQQIHKEHSPHFGHSAATHTVELPHNNTTLPSHPFVSSTYKCRISHPFPKMRRQTVAEIGANTALLSIPQTQSQCLGSFWSPKTILKT